MLTEPIARTWLNGVLTGDATLMALGSPPLSNGLRVYTDFVPQRKEPLPPNQPDPNYPAVIISYVSGIPITFVGGTDAFSALTFLIVAADRGAGSGTAAIAPIADRLDALLQGAFGTVPNGEVLTCSKNRLLGEFRRLNPEQGGLYDKRVGRHWNIEAR